MNSPTAIATPSSTSAFPTSPPSGTIIGPATVAVNQGSSLTGSERRQRDLAEQRGTGRAGGGGNVGRAAAQGAIAEQRERRRLFRRIGHSKRGMRGNPRRRQRRPEAVRNHRIVRSAATEDHGIYRPS